MRGQPEPTFAASACFALSFVAVLLVAACSDGNEATESDERTPGASTATLDCADSIDAVPVPPESYEAIADVVALPTSSSATSALQTRARDEVGGLRLFAKTGLLVKAGAEATLVVPQDWRGRLAIGWDNKGEAQPVAVFQVGPCDVRLGEWLAFPGGFYVEDASCVPLLIRDGEDEHRVHVGVGAPCEGQEPPPIPSDL